MYNSLSSPISVTCTKETVIWENLVGLKKANDMYDWKLNQQLCHVLMLLSYKTTINCTFDSKHSAEKDTTSINNGEKKSISEVSGEKVFLFSG